MKMSDDLFDNQIRKKLKDEISCVPEDVNKKIDESVKRIEKKRFNLKKISSICSILIICTLLFGITIPTYASNIPIIGNIFKIFNDKAYENYDKYTSDLNITKESNGLKMTINKVVYDGFELSLLYTVESQEEIKEEPRFPGAELKINGKKTTFGGGGTGKFINDNKTFVGVMEYHVRDKNYDGKDIKEKKDLGDYVEIPDKFVLSLNINELGVEKPVKGEWDFNIPVSSEKVNGKVKETECNIDLSNVSAGYHINKIITTPLNTLIQGIRKNKEEEKCYLNFAVFDNKGRYIEQKSGSTTGTKDGMYFNNSFKEIYDDTESLTFIPYKQKFDGESENSANKIVTKLNLQGETKIYSSDGKEYATITKVESEDGKTKIHYKSVYGICIAPIEIVNNKTNEKMLSIDREYDAIKQKEDITYINSSDEYVINCDKAISDGEYSVIARDKSKSIQPYNEDKFTIKIK